MNTRPRANLAQNGGNWISNWRTALAAVVFMVVVMTYCGSKLPESQSGGIPQNTIEESAAEVVTPTGSPSLQSVEETPVSVPTPLPPNATSEASNGDLVNAQDVDSEEVISKSFTSEKNREPYAPEAEFFALDPESELEKEIQVVEPWEDEDHFHVGILTEDGTIRVERPLIEDYNNIPDSYFYAFDIEIPPEPRDELIVESFDIRECVARGFVRNLSDKMFARDVVVTLESLDGADGATWHWPLTVMPGERAPFEIAIDWVPSRLPIDSPHFGTTNERISPWGYQEVRTLRREPAGNVLANVTYNLSTDVDVSRAFGNDFDRSEILERNRPSYLMIFDERLYELEEWGNWSRGPEHHLVSRESFEQAYPSVLVDSVDLDAIVSEFSMLQHSDLYYIPERVFPQHYDEILHIEVNNIRVFRAITESNRVLDVIESIPFKVEFDEDNDGTRRRIVVPHTSFINFDSGGIDPIFAIRTTPEIYAEITGMTETSAFSRRTSVQTWVGKADSMEPLSNRLRAVSRSDTNLEEHRGWSSGSCDRSGGLTKEDYEIIGSARADTFDVTLGYYGLFNDFQSYPGLAESILVDPFTVSADNGFVRGLIHNVSDRLFARDVTVRVVRANNVDTENSWAWPLTIQPGERAPFEIYIGGWEGSAPNSEFEFNVSATLSERVDISRSFRITHFAVGSVYEKEADARLEESSYWWGDYEGYITDNYFKIYQHVSRDIFMATYGHLLCELRPKDTQADDAHLRLRTEENCYDFETPAGFVDLYAYIDTPDSHPTLSAPIGYQAIDDLRAYVAIVDRNGVVSDVKKAVLFTTGYSSATRVQEYVAVDRIPVPNLLQPGGVRLLFTRPHYEDSWLEEGYSFQVWIGGV